MSKARENQRFSRALLYISFKNSNYTLHWVYDSASTS